MNILFENHTQILEKLSKLKFVKRDTNKLISEEGFTLSWEFVFAIHTTSEMPVQLVLRIYHGDAYVTSWGCTSRMDTFDFVKFIQQTEGKVSDYKYDLQDETSAQAKKLFKNL